MSNLPTQIETDVDEALQILSEHVNDAALPERIHKMSLDIVGCPLADLSNLVPPMVGFAGVGGRTDGDGNSTLIRISLIDVDNTPRTLGHLRGILMHELTHAYSCTKRDDCDGRHTDTLLWKASEMASEALKARHGDLLF